VIAAKLTGILHSYTWGIFITSQASLVAIPVFLLALRYYRTPTVRLDVMFEGNTP